MAYAKASPFGGGSGGSGDVVGPVSATDNAIARFDSITGKLLQNSVVIADDDGNISGLKTIYIRNDDDLSGAADNVIRVDNRYDSATSHGHIEFRRARASNANLSNGDEIGGINFHPRHNSTTLSSAEILAIYTGDGTTRLADFSFLTSNAGAPTEKMRLTAAGSLQLSALTATTVPYIDASKGFASSAVTPTELGYVSGVTSAIQTQLNAKAPSASPTFSGTITTPLTASRAMVTGASNELAVSAVTATELGYVSGVTSAIQTQLNAKGVGDMTLSGVQTVTGAKTFGTIGGTVGKFILAGSTSGSTIVNAAAVAGSTTITLPGATDTLVGRATTDTLTNKTLSGNTATNLISGSGTLTLNTSGTVTLPNATDTLVGKATTDTLTNKTLTSPTITGTGAIAGTFTGNLTGNVTGNVSGSSGSTTGNAATATALATPRAINGTNFDGTAAITVTAAAGTLTGATLNSGVTASSLTSVGALNSGSITSGFGAIDVGADNITGASLTGSTSIITPLVKAYDGNGIKFQENGGTEIGSATDAGAWTLGAASSTQIFNVNASNITLTRADNSKTVLTASGSTTFLDSYGLNASTKGSFSFRSFSSDLSLSLTAGSVNDLGAWTLGASSGTSSTNTIQAAMITPLTINRTNAGSQSIAVNQNGTAQFRIGYDYVANDTVTGTVADDMVIRNMSATGGFLFAANSTTVAAKCTYQGAWTLGPSSGSTQEHFFQSGANTYLAIKSASNNLSGLELYNNTTAAWNILNVGTAAANGLEIRNASNAAMAAATQAGAWTLGAAETNQTQTVYGKALVRGYASGGSAVHEFQNRNTANSAGGSSYLKATSYSSTAGLILSNSSTDRWLIGSDTSESSSSLYFYNYDSAAAIVGKVSTAGAWTFGTSGGTQTHSINGTQVNFTSTSTSTAFFHNYSTGATLRAQVGVNGTSATIIAGALGTANYYQIAAVSGIEFGDTANNVRGRMVSSTGAWSNTAGGSWGTLSDIRLKDNISDLASGLSLICSLRPVAYTWTNAEFGVNRPTVGFIAQEIEQVNPSWIQTVESVKLSDQEEIKDVKEIHMDASFNAYLVKAIQELKAELDEAKAEIEILKGN